MTNKEYYIDKKIGSIEDAIKSFGYHMAFGVQEENTDAEDTLNEYKYVWLEQQAVEKDFTCEEPPKPFKDF